MCRLITLCPTNTDSQNMQGDEQSLLKALPAFPLTLSSAVHYARSNTFEVVIEKDSGCVMTFYKPNTNVTQYFDTITRVSRLTIVQNSLGWNLLLGLLRYLNGNPVPGEVDVGGEGVSNCSPGP
eukprot:scpid71646/ scgid6976/ 